MRTVQSVGLVTWEEEEERLPARRRKGSAGSNNGNEKEKKINNVEWIDREEWKRKIKLWKQKYVKSLIFCTYINSYTPSFKIFVSGLFLDVDSRISSDVENMIKKSYLIVLSL
jgi:hypothetical protein